MAESCEFPLRLKLHMSSRVGILLLYPECYRGKFQLMLTNLVSWLSNEQTPYRDSTIGLPRYGNYSTGTGTPQEVRVAAVTSEALIDSGHVRSHRMLSP